ncbi:hypothetical protein BLNAU_3272 [Blattamonas nauphoetae]|uniref:Uncharacterized protein n=1 Tax=Blattamonas nauphoetae TaxID=2049346 RepID=A0ABQ9YDS1_9EUKA|nr:hypothetical protein BLNAU_3272 [Blattamonas nauphoetae]
MTSSQKYSAFLKWNENDPDTVDSFAPAFMSLVSMVRDGSKRVFECDCARLPKPRCSVCGFDDCSLVYIQSIDILDEILSRPKLHDLSLTSLDYIPREILRIADSGVQLASDDNVRFLHTKFNIDTQFVRDVMTRETKRTLSLTSHISLDIQMTSHADSSMLPTRSVLTLWYAPFSIFILVFDSFFLIRSLLFRFQGF